MPLSGVSKGLFPAMTTRWAFSRPAVQNLLCCRPLKAELCACHRIVQGGRCGLLRERPELDECMLSSPMAGEGFIICSYMAEMQVSLCC